MYEIDEHFDNRFLFYGQMQRSVNKVRYADCPATSWHGGAGHRHAFRSCRPWKGGYQAVAHQWRIEGNCLEVRPQIQEGREHTANW